MAVTLTSKRSVFPLRIPVSLFLKALEYAEYQGWKAEQRQGGDTLEARFNRYLSGTSVSEADARELHKAINNAIKDPTIDEETRTPAFMSALEAVRDVSVSGPFETQPSGQTPA